MGRAPCCDKANVKKGPWSPEEDAKLKAYIDKFGTGGNWIALPQKIGLKRCGKSCRLRWLNYLRPNIKHGGFTEEEDNIICSLYISIGSRWSIIAAQLPGRTDNDIKNYWNTRLKKKLLGRRKQLNANEYSNGEDFNNLQNLSNSALERLQLHLQLQNPFSFYNNPALWPKLINPLQQQMNIDENENQTIIINQNNPSSPQPHDPILQQDYRFSSTLKEDEFVINSTNCFSSSENKYFPSNNKANNIQESGFTEAEIDDLLNNRSSSSNFLATGNQAAEFDCFKEMDIGSKDNIEWWPNEFDVNSTSSSSWDSATMLHQSEEIYGDYVDIGYSMQ